MCGITYMHEHMKIDLSKVKGDLDCKLDNFQDILSELKELSKIGVKNIIEVTNIGMGRDVEYVKKLQKESGINMLCATGFYKEPFLPDFVYNKSSKELSKLFINEIENGINDSGIKPSIIGEVGSSLNKITEIEEKVITAAAMAHNETGKPITIHTTLGTMGLEIVELLKKYNVDLEKVILDHVALKNDMDYILALVDKGVTVEFDTIAKEKYLSDKVRVNMLKKLSEQNLLSRAVLSMDITRKSHYKKNGGPGYSYLIDNFIPELKKVGISQDEIDLMLIDNPYRIFGGELK